MQRKLRYLDISMGRRILESMTDKPRKALKISLRLPGGWSKPIENLDFEECDIDGAQLWIGPGGQIYCDLMHELE